MNEIVEKYYWLNDREYAVGYHNPGHLALDFSVFDRYLGTATAPPAKIRVTLSRPLTWAEWEYLERTLREQHISLKRDRGADFSIVHLSANQNSRELFEVLAEYLAGAFVNVYPRAVLTKQEHQ